MDGDSSARTLDASANSAIRNTEGIESIHEASHQSDPVGQKTQGKVTPVFHRDGAIGSMFKADGAIGGTADRVGGPFARDGVVGEKFNANGAIGGKIHESLGKNE
ncbi:hypothetical protein NA56DRAFT_566227 [Hyaloscypha hepaticicola]|uniref:Uncharacterized protein n=1 Tax=Hyaloscypha hepaticicola TaxID=2082293 RepID=A0A2J6QFH1_9HELO|nr:hypothetical protein NA56DRAFT_566227 [Hyaloscypha hepaticicola]